MDENTANMENGTFDKVCKMDENTANMENGTFDKKKQKKGKKKKQKEQSGENVKSNSGNTDSSSKTSLDKVSKKMIYTLIILIGLMLIVATIFTHWTEVIGYNKSCDIKDAVEYLKLNFTVKCKFEDLIGYQLCILVPGIVSVVLDFFFLLPGMFFFFNFNKRREKTCVIYAVFGGLSLLFSVALVTLYVNVVISREAQTDVDYDQLRSAMMFSLTQNYESDIITSQDTISDRWNKFFIQYDCCAVDQVPGTTNNFDTTPWCTTAGSCQQTNSQIPKTCCKGVSTYDYQSSPNDCYATVTAGTFKDGCFRRVQKLSNMAIEEYKLDMFSIFAITLGIMKFTASFVSMYFVIAVIIQLKNENKTKDDPKGGQNQKSQGDDGNKEKDKEDQIAKNERPREISTDETHREVQAKQNQNPTDKMNTVSTCNA